MCACLHGAHTKAQSTFTKIAKGIFFVLRGEQAEEEAPAESIKILRPSAVCEYPHQFLVPSALLQKVYCRALCMGLLNILFTIPHGYMENM